MKNKKTKYVKESLDEKWVSNDTGIELFYDGSYPQPEEDFPSDVTEIIPDPEYKFTEQDFEEYIDELIEEILPKQPQLALEAFKGVLEQHPYLKKRTIGFKGGNPYEKSIMKFMQSFKQFVHANR